MGKFRKKPPAPDTTWWLAGNLAGYAAENSAKANKSQREHKLMKARNLLPHHRPAAFSGKMAASGFTDFGDVKLWAIF